MRGDQKPPTVSLHMFAVLRIMAFMTAHAAANLNGVYVE
jgi:hypothetical protein